MLKTCIMFNGEAKQAIALYQKAFGAELLSIKTEGDGGPGERVHFAELSLRGAIVLLGDVLPGESRPISGGYQLVVQFDSIYDMTLCYREMQPGSTLLSPPHATSLSSCVLQFIDRFDIRWLFLL